MAILNDTTIDIHGATLTRRQFVKTGGALVVGFSLVGTNVWKNPVQAAVDTNTLDPTLPGSWVEIHADDTILIRTGKSDFGQSTVTTAYRQIVAEELSAPYEAVTTVVMGDTDRTPDGGGVFALLGGNAANLRKVAAYTREALLDVAATRLGVPRGQLVIKDGVVLGGGRRVSYGQLVQGQQLSLSIRVSGKLSDMRGLTVLGDPPLKPASEYTIVGKSYSNYSTASKVAAKKEVWATDVRLPGMLHARVVHPKTLGSTLLSAGEVDRDRFPNAQVVVKANLVGVLAPTEWEAIGAARQVAADTEWTDWKGLPGSTDLFRWLRHDADWSVTPVTTSDPSKGNVGPALDAAAQRLSATYELPYKKHAPIGPTMAVADAKSDGTVYIYTHNQNAQVLRSQIARMLGASVANVVVRTFSGSGHYGRSNGGNAGAEDEAVILERSGVPFGCSGCVPTTSSGRRPRRLDYRTSRSRSTLAVRSPGSRSTTTCRRCRTTDRSGQYSPGCRLSHLLTYRKRRRAPRAPRSTGRWIPGCTTVSRISRSADTARFSWGKRPRH